MARGEKGSTWSRRWGVGRARAASPEPVFFLLSCWRPLISSLRAAQCHGCRCCRSPREPTPVVRSVTMASDHLLRKQRQPVTHVQLVAHETASSRTPAAVGPAPCLIANQRVSARQHPDLAWRRRSGWWDFASPGPSELTNPAHPLPYSSRSRARRSTGPALWEGRHAFGPPCGTTAPCPRRSRASVSVAVPRPWHPCEAHGCGNAAPASRLCNPLPPPDCRSWKELEAPARVPIGCCAFTRLLTRSTGRSSHRRRPSGRPG